MVTITIILHGDTHVLPWCPAFSSGSACSAPPRTPRQLRAYPEPTFRIRPSSAGQATADRLHGAEPLSSLQDPPCLYPKAEGSMAHPLRGAMRSGSEVIVLWHPLSVAVISEGGHSQEGLPDVARPGAPDAPMPPSPTSPAATEPLTIPLTIPYVSSTTVDKGH